MKFLLISPKNRTIYNFRGELIQEIQKKGYEVLVTGPNEDNIDKILKLGVRFCKIPLKKNGLSLIDDAKYFFALYKLFIREKPDITLGYTIKPVIYGALAAKLAGIKNINSMITGAGYIFTSKSKKAKLLKIFVKMLYRLGLSCAGTVIFQNKDDLNDFTEQKLLNSKKCRLVNGSGVNLEKFKPLQFPQRLTFFMLSRLLHSKGVNEYLQAAKMIKSEYPEVEFMLLGALENMQDSITSETLDFYINENIISYYTETDNVNQFYEKCSVYVLPSYREGVPRTVLEAMAVGRPVITTDAPGCRETVKEGYNGFLVPIQDVDALAKKMEWFITNQEQIPIMGQASYDYCLEKFDVKKVNQVMLEYMNIKEKETLL